MIFGPLYRRRLPLTVLLFAMAQAVVAQMNLSPAQMRAVQNLSPEQQAALMEAVASGQLPPSTAAGGAALDTEQPLDAFQSQIAPLDGSRYLVDGELRIEGGETIVMNATVREEFEGSDEFEIMMLDVNRKRLVGRNALQLDKQGVLDLPGIASIPLAGLSEEEIAIRLESEILLEPLEIEIVILPLTPIGRDALEPFGYKLFEDLAEAFIQSQENILVPRDYVLGPGDAITVQLYGEENFEVTLEVNADGAINFPRTGPRIVAGLTFAEMKEDIEQRVSDQLIGTSVAVTMSRLRAIQVFVVGDVRRPGAYQLNSLSRVTNALFASGGVSKIGSMRGIQLKRAGSTVRTLDLYDLLLKGDTRNDERLKTGDVVFIPPVEYTVSVEGEVRRPAIYEIRRERTIGELLELAGGLHPYADRRNVRLERITDGGMKEIETVDLSDASGPSMQTRPGDLLRVFPVIDEIGDGVFLGGHVRRPGGYEWNPGMTVTDLLPTSAYLKPRADLSYALVRRETGADRQVEVFSVDLGAAQAAPKSVLDLPLNQRDQVTIFELGVRRTAMVDDILVELQAQATADEPAKVVRIVGNVRAPGNYPLESDMRISDLLRAGGGLNASAFSAAAELTRYRISPEGERRTELLPVDLAAIRAGDLSADVVLQAYDYLSIREVPEWQNQFEVELVGEVRFPGTYAVRQGETLSSVIDRAGGLTSQAFPEGGVFTRDILRQREAEQIRELTRRLESDLAALALRAANDPSGGLRSTEASSYGASLLETLRNTEPTGRLVIDLPSLLAEAKKNGGADIVLRDGDRLMIPTRAQEVTVLGEVQYATSHFFDPDTSRDGYINLSGGTTVNADDKRIYVVRANGAVVAGRSSRWFGRGDTRIYPGDTVVVPLDTDRLPSLTQWASITQIVYNLALAAAAVNSF